MGILAGKKAKNKPSHRKFLREGRELLKRPHSRAMIFLIVIVRTHGGMIWLSVIRRAYELL